jgi:hypothetical protein
MTMGSAITFFFSPFQIIMFNVVSGDGGGSRKGEGGEK